MDANGAEHVVGLLVFDGVTMLDATGPADALGLARRFSDGPTAGYRTVLISPRGGSVLASSGLVLADSVAPDDAPALDTLIVAGGERLALPETDPELLEATRVLSAETPRVASVCTGAFVLAQLGMLDGREATTHWRHVDAFRDRFPRVRMRPSELTVQHGRMLSSAGITAGIDLALRLVEADHGAPVARRVAQELVMFMRRPGGQLQFAGEAGAESSARSESLRAVLRDIESSPAEPHDTAAMARRMAVSQRHLSRIFRAELGTTPSAWVEKVRLDRAKTLLLEGHGVTETARLSGFGGDENLRRVFLRRLGVTPTGYRSRFASSQGR